jgi:hypothetical protein
MLFAPGYVRATTGSSSRFTPRRCGDVTAEFAGSCITHGIGGLMFYAQFNGPVFAGFSGHFHLLDLELLVEPRP